jgi:hypothetical protein
MEDLVVQVVGENMVEDILLVVGDIDECSKL